jgi:hypothetical protein
MCLESFILTLPSLSPLDGSDSEQYCFSAKIIQPRIELFSEKM